MKPGCITMTWRQSNNQWSGLQNLEQRAKKIIELRGEYVE